MVGASLSGRSARRAAGHESEIFPTSSPAAVKSFIARYPITLLIIAIAIALAAAAPARAGVVSAGPVLVASIAAPTPVPETGSTLALFAAVAMGTYLVRRRLVPVRVK